MSEMNLKPKGLGVYWVGLKVESGVEDDFAFTEFVGEIVPPIDAENMTFTFGEDRVPTDTVRLPLSTRFSGDYNRSAEESNDDQKAKLRAALQSLLSPTGLVDVFFYDPDLPEG